MPKGGAKGRGQGGRPGLDKASRNGESVPGGSQMGRDGAGDRPPPMDPGGPMHTDGTPDVDTEADVHGRSESSPGHLKKAAGARSARDFAPGQANRERTARP